MSIKIIPQDLNKRTAYAISVSGRMLTAHSYKVYTGLEYPDDAIFSKMDDFKTMFLPTYEKAEEVAQTLADNVWKHRTFFAAFSKEDPPISRFLVENRGTYHAEDDKLNLGLGDGEAVRGYVINGAYHAIFTKDKAYIYNPDIKKLHTVDITIPWSMSRDSKIHMDYDNYNEILAGIEQELGIGAEQSAPKPL